MNQNLSFGISVNLVFKKIYIFNKTALDRALQSKADHLYNVLVMCIV